MTLPLHYLAPKASPDPQDPNHPAWKAAPLTPLFQDISTTQKPRLSTTAQICWDDNYLYIRADLQEPDIWATHTQHDSIVYQENDFEWFIDPDGDCHNYYEWEVNALNTTMDLFMNRPYRAGGHFDMSWEIPGLVSTTILEGALNVPSATCKQWTVLCAVPWPTFQHHTSPGLPPKPGDQWRINFSRVEWDLLVQDDKYVKKPNTPEHNWVWSPQGIIDMHCPWMWGVVQFTDGKSATEYRPDPDLPLKVALGNLFLHHQMHGNFPLSLPPGVEISSLNDGGYHARVKSKSRGWLQIDNFCKLVHIN